MSFSLLIDYEDICSLLSPFFEQENVLAERNKLIFQFLPFHCVLQFVVCPIFGMFSMNY